MRNILFPFFFSLPWAPSWFHEDGSICVGRAQNRWRRGNPTHPGHWESGGIQKVIVTFSGKAHDHINADGTVGHCFNGSHPWRRTVLYRLRISLSTLLLPATGRVHEIKAKRLLLATSGWFHRCEQVGSDGRNSVPAYLKWASRAWMRYQKQTFSSSPSMTRWCRQNRPDLPPERTTLYPHGRNFVGVFHNVGHSITMTTATSLGNGAKLHYSRNHPAPWGKNGYNAKKKKNYKLIDLAYIARFDMFCRHGWVHRWIYDVEFFGSTQGSVDTGNRRRNFFFSSWA